MSSGDSPSPGATIVKVGWVDQKRGLSVLVYEIDDDIVARETSLVDAQAIALSMH